MRSRYTWLLLLAAPICWACKSDEPVGEDESGSTEGTATTLLFAGIESASCEGDNGFLVTWSEAESDGEVSYTIVARRLESGVRYESEPLGGTSGVIGGLDPGEYRVSVEAFVERVGHEDGDRSIEQLIGENRLVYRSEVPMDLAADVWGEGDVVAVAGYYSEADLQGEEFINFKLFDVSDVTQPVQLSKVTTTSVVKDVKLSDGLLYANSECECGPGDPRWDTYDEVAARIYDIEDPTNPVLVGSIGDPHRSAHNLWYADGYLVLAENDTYSAEIYDVSDPTSPTWVSRWEPPSGLVHDMVWIEDRLYVAFINGFAILDVSDPGAPNELALQHYSDPFQYVVHNIWPTQDREHVLVTEEVPGGHVQIWSIADPDDIHIVSQYSTHPEHMVHNAHVRGDLAFVSYYWDGVRVLDIGDVAHPQEIGFYDTFDEEESGSGSLIQGAWGVWPYGEHVAVSDIRNGLFLFDVFPKTISVEP